MVFPYEVYRGKCVLTLSGFWNYPHFLVCCHILPCSKPSTICFFCSLLLESYLPLTFLFCLLLPPSTFKDPWNYIGPISKIKLSFLLPAAIKKLPLLGVHPKNSETLIQNLCTPMFTATQFTITKCWKQPRCPPVNEWIKKLWYIYTMEYYAAERKRELLPFTTA